MQADVSFTVGNRVFYVICEVLSMKGLSGRVHAMMVSPAALLVEEEEHLYSLSLGERKIDVEEILRLVPSLREKVRKASVAPEPAGLLPSHSLSTNSAGFGSY
jgi:hypothetical protein